MRKFLKIQKNRGMTYVELIVVLSIFSVMSAVVMYNYGEFQAKVDIKNLASDIALQIVQAQKSSLNGVLPAVPPVDWKPSYGVYFDTTITLPQFVYFADLNSDSIYNDTPIDTIFITKNNIISKIEKCSDEACAPGAPTTDSLSITFVRPNSGAFFANSTDLLEPDFSYIQITVQSPKTSSAKIKIYPSGRVQVN